MTPRAQDCLPPCGGGQGRVAPAVVDGAAPPAFACSATPQPNPPPQLGRGLRAAPSFLALLTLAACAEPGAGPLRQAGAKLAPECVARVNKAALVAMNRTNPLGQMQIFGPPTVFNPHLLRVTVRVDGARTEIYSVDLSIDDDCRVLSASTRLETNEWPVR